MAVEVYKNPEDLLIEIKTDFANLIRNYRGSLEMTQEQFAEYCSLTSRAIQNYEAGRIPTPTKIKVLFKNDLELYKKAKALSDKFKAVKISMKHDATCPVESDGPHKIISPGLAVNLNTPANYFGEKEWLWNHVLENVKEKDRNFVIFAKSIFVCQVNGNSVTKINHLNEFKDILKDYDIHLVNIGLADDCELIHFDPLIGYPKAKIRAHLKSSAIDLSYRFMCQGFPYHTISRTEKKYRKDELANIAGDFISAYFVYKYFVNIDTFPRSLTFSIDDHESISADIVKMREFYTDAPECIKNDIGLYESGKTKFLNSYNVIDDISPFDEYISKTVDPFENNTTDFILICFRVINRSLYIANKRENTCYNSSLIKEILNKDKQCIIFSEDMLTHFSHYILDLLSIKNKDAKPIDFYFFIGETRSKDDGKIDYDILHNIEKKIENKNNAAYALNSYSIMLPPKQSYRPQLGGKHKKYIDNEQVVIDGQTKIEIIKIPGKEESIIRYV